MQQNWSKPALVIFSLCVPFVPLPGIKPFVGPAGPITGGNATSLLSLLRTLYLYAGGQGARWLSLTGRAIAVPAAIGATASGSYLLGLSARCAVDCARDPNSWY